MNEIPYADQRWSVKQISEEEGLSDNRVATYLCRYRKQGYFPPGRGSGRPQPLTPHDRAVFSFLLKNNRGPGKGIFAASIIPDFVAAIRNAALLSPSVSVVWEEWTITTIIDWPEPQTQIQSSKQGENQ